MTKALVSILTYNGDQRTINTISDVLAQQCGGIETDIIVIDNASTNGIADRIKAVYPHIRIHQTKENIGYSGGHNIAIDLALQWESDFLFVLNDDIQLPPSYIQRMVHEGETARGCRGARVCHTHSERHDAGGMRFSEAVACRCFLVQGQERTA